MKIITYGDNQTEVPDNYKYLGWRNNWKEEPKEYLNCIKKEHSVKDISLSNRGSDNVISCDICKIYWELDSSD
jgi:hypothetical protein